MARSRHDAVTTPPEWVFRWAPLGTPWFPKLFALALSAALFAALLGSVRVEIRTPGAWAPPHASVIHVGADPAGRALTRKAIEGGPFPSRFDPAEWTGFASLERAVREPLDWQPAEYQPRLRSLPGDGSGDAPLPLVAPGKLVFPKTPQPPLPDVAAGNLRFVPVIEALAGLRAENLPDPLPAFHGVDPKLAASPRLFLARLRPDGTVIDAVPLGGGDKGNDDHLQRLGHWLRSLRFAPADATETRWITVGVRFVNQPSDNADQPE